jgi:FkbM family methyltransferase
MAGMMVIQRLLQPQYVKQLIGTIHDVVNKLPLVEAGMSNDGLAYVVLENGITLYDHPSENYLRWLWRLFTPTRYKTLVPEVAFSAAWDAWLRYWHLGIMDQQRYYRLQPGDVAVEAGAYIGYYVIKMAQAVGNDGHVVAIEADGDNLRLLRKNVEANDLKNVTVVPRGVWNSPGKIHFYKVARQKNSLVREVLSSEGASVFTVQTDTIDNILRNVGIDAVDFAIITVNDAEVEALEGMGDILSRGCHLAVAARYKRDGVPTYEIVARKLQGLGYIVFLEDDVFYFSHPRETHIAVFASPPGKAPVNPIYLGRDLK